eukprot:SM000092S24485  [mRNA]  locus=s92:230783:232892:+ [translate_table: standard]
MVVSTVGDVRSKDWSDRLASTAMAASSTSSPGDCDGDGEGAGEIYFEPAMFVCESYALREFAFGPERVVLRTLLAASTDYDLTGQIVWPGAELLATHLAASPGELAGAAVLELGAGVGLVGLLCARWCSKVVMTDHNDVVLKVLQSNIDLHNEEVQASGHHQAADPLAVGLYGMHFCSQEASGSRAPGALPPLQRRRPGQSRSSCRMLLAYVSRTRSVDMLVHAEAEARGLRLVELPGTRRKVASGTLEGLVYEAAVPDLGSSNSADSGGIKAQQT